MKKLFHFLFLFFVTALRPALSQSVKILYEKDLPQAAYAAGKLRKALPPETTLSQATYTIRLILKKGELEKEAYAIIPGPAQPGKGHLLTIAGGDERGLIYGALSVAEDLNNGIPLARIRAAHEKPHYPLRAIKFDLPWDTYRHSYALDLHGPTCKDLHYWEAFLDMMVEDRFNALSLWNLHPYPILIRAKNFPEACPFTDRELKEWQDLFHGIFRMAKERCIDTYLIPFNIFVSPEFSRAHQVAMDNLQHDFFVKGDTSEIVKRYTRESVTQVLQEYPDLTGFGLTLGEGMAGMTPQQREDWMKATIIEGMRLAHRKTKLIHRIPFSSTTGSLDVTSIATEQLTRKTLEEEAGMDFIEGPIWADLKYNWSHAHSTPKLIKVHGGKLYDTYFKPEPQVYKITWTARNEDFFCLRWGVPDFIRTHIATNSQTYTGGYFIGSETYIPAKDYFTKPGGDFDWQYAFQRQWLFYKLWGRLLYDPATPDALFRDEFVRRYGKKATPLLEAFALAGRTPLRLASSFDFTWDFSLYSEGFLALNTQTKNVEYISVDRQISQPPTDPDYISVQEYVKTLSSGGSFDKTKITPLLLAQQLEQDCNKALALVAHIALSGSSGDSPLSNPSRHPGISLPSRRSDSSLLYEISDVKVWAELGLYFAQKLRGAVALQSFRVKGNPSDKKEAVQHLEKALTHWDKVVAITTPLYKEMPLVHYSEQNGVRSRDNDKYLFHWEKIRPDVARDVEIARNAIPGPISSH